MRLLLLLISSFLVGIQAQVISTGACPNVAVKPDFDVSQYLGHWFEIRRYPTFFQIGARCSKAEYSVLSEGIIRVNNTATRKKDQVQSVVGQAYAPDPSVPAKLIVNFEGNPFAAPYWVIDTDYTNYAIVYSCNSIALLKTEFAWVLSRNVTLDPSFEPKIATLLDANQIRKEKFMNSPHENCYNY